MGNQYGSAEAAVTERLAALTLTSAYGDHRNGGPTPGVAEDEQDGVHEAGQKQEACPGSAAGTGMAGVAGEGLEDWKRSGSEGKSKARQRVV